MGIFDSDQIYSADSLHGMYDSEYDNYRGAGHVTSDAESDFAHEDDSEVGGVLDELSLENIRQISQNITSKFGATRSEDEGESDDVVRTPVTSSPVQPLTSPTNHRFLDFW